MSAADHLSPSQFVSVHDAVYKYDKTDVQGEPMYGLTGDAGPHSRGRDWADLQETKWDHAPEHTESMLHDVARRGVREPIGIDRSTTPPTVSDGHTRLMAAHAAGMRRIPYRDLPIGQAENRKAPRS